MTEQGKAPAALATSSMLGLTLHRPWEASILFLGKDIENRKWHPGSHVRGQRIALHAGKGWDEKGAEFIAEHGWPGELARRLKESRGRDSLIVGTVRVTGWYRYPLPPFDTSYRSRWAFGPWCWRLADAFVLPDPVPCRGALGLWKLPPDVEAKVLASERGPVGDPAEGRPSPEIPAIPDSKG